MRKELGLAGLLLTGVFGCQMDRPYNSRYTAVQNHFAPSDTAYRPKTVVTMRAEEVPDNPGPVQASGCPAVQLVSAASTTVSPAPSQTAGSTPMVVVTIPAMKIAIPVTATGVTPPTAAKETTVTQLPPAVSSVVQASSTASIASSSKHSKASDAEVHPAVHVQKEEKASTSTSASSPPTSSASTSSSCESAPMPDPIPEPKPKSKSAKKQTDAAQPPKLSLLPPDPPPDVPVPMHRTTSPASTLRITEPPPPPPIPKSSSSGPVLPSEEPELK